MGRLSVIKGLLTITLLGHCLVTLGQYTQSASQTLTNLPAGAIIEIPLTLNKDMDLSFGSVVPGNTPGTVIIYASASASRTSTGGVSVLSQDTFNAACFSITGTAGTSYSISLPNSVTLSGPGSNTMTVNNFTDNSSETLNNSGAGTFYVGATLHIGAQQTKGSYSGSFNVSVNY
jgi:hypothetical protein